MKKASSPGSKATSGTGGKKVSAQAASTSTTTELIKTTTTAAAVTTTAHEENGANNFSDQDAMSDDEDSAVLLRMESDVSLPRAPVKQLIMEKLPEQARIHQQSKELISNLCMHFLSHLAEQSNEFCSAQNKKTVCPDHVLDALTKMNLTRYFPQLAALDEEQLKQKAAVTTETLPGMAGRKKRGKSTAAAKELIAQTTAERESEWQLDPKKMKQAILTRLNASMEGCSKMRDKFGKNKAENDRGDDLLTDEQRNLEQEKLFREAREQYDQQQLAAQQAAVEQSTSQQQMSGGGQFDYNGEGGNMMMNYDGNAPMDGMNDMMDNNMPPFNPTDYFRDMIFSTDFMAEQDLPVYDAPMEMNPIDEIINEGDADMVQDDQNAACVTVIDVDNEHQGNDGGHDEFYQHPSTIMAAEAFAFDDEELEALQAFEKVQRSTVASANAVASSEAGAGRQRAGTARNDVENNTKPKEQNDQEMKVVEESKNQPKD